MCRREIKTLGNMPLDDIIYQYQDNNNDYHARVTVHASVDDASRAYFYGYIVFESKWYNDSCRTSKFSTLGDAVISSGYHIRVYVERMQVEKRAEEVDKRSEEHKQDNAEPIVIYEKTLAEDEYTFHIKIAAYSSDGPYYCMTYYDCKYFGRPTTKFGFKELIEAAIFAGEELEKCRCRRMVYEKRDNHE
jgi:hypothetical protein